LLLAADCTEIVTFVQRSPKERAAPRSGPQSQYQWV
jgi:hypothetical protein